MREAELVKEGRMFSNSLSYAKYPTEALRVRGIYFAHCLCQEGLVAIHGGRRGPS